MTRNSTVCSVLTCIALAHIFMVNDARAFGTQVQVGETAILRSAPGESSRAIARIPAGSGLWAVRGVGPEWTEVSPPQALSVWIYSSLVKDGVVAAPSVYVRSGPGVEYAPIGALRKGLRLAVRDEKDGWLRIDPPSECTLFIRTSKLRGTAPTVMSAQPPSRQPPPPRRPARPDPAEQGEPLGRPTPVGPAQPPPPATPVAAAGSGLAEGRTAPADGPATRRTVTGPLIDLVGVVRPAGAHVWRRPGKYRLVATDSQGRARTLCYLVGDEKRLSEAVGYRVRATGRREDRFGVRYDALIVDRLSRP